MKPLWGTWEADRETLDKQYVRAWLTDENSSKIKKLRNEILLLADSMPDTPHPVAKARCFAYVLEHADLLINPDDWFGIAPEAVEFVEENDRGVVLGKAMDVLSERWKNELSDVLYPPEVRDFQRQTGPYLLNEFYIDYNHSTPCWDDLFALGLSGILARVREYKTARQAETGLTLEQAAYFEGMELAYEAILRFFHRVSTVLEHRTEPKLQKMHEAVCQLIENPPANTYEAMLLEWIYWFLQENVDGVRARTIGGADQLYWNFYQNDLKNGTFTKEQIRELWTYFMHEFHAFRVMYQQPMYLGGQNEQGECIVNELSYLILDAYNILSTPNPKLQAKISRDTPEEFLRAVMLTIQNGNTSISVMNDDNTTQALLKLGVPLAEARTALMSGCWDCSVKYHEVKTIPVRISLPKVLEYTLTGGRCLSLNEQVGPETGCEFADFESFLHAFETQWEYFWFRSKAIIEHWERYFAEISPSNLYSATMTDSLKQAVDGYARGMKYNTTTFTVCGLASLVDGLCAVKNFVFDRAQITLPELVRALEANWVGYESLRTQILHSNDKYGNGSSLADGLMVRLYSFFAKHINGTPNGRGSYWKYGVLSIDKNVRFGAVTKASADGRKAGEPFSKNLASVIGMDRGGVTSLINSVSKLDFTYASHAGMLDLLLHPSAVSGEEGLDALCAIVRTYFAKGGHSLQFNIFDSATLRRAQEHPEQYRNLQIRVCGWNVYFVDLEKVLQDSFIQQCEHYESL